MPASEQQITETISNKPDIPPDVKVGDIIVGKYTDSEWNRYMPWEEWDHAALITRIDPFTIIEATGIILDGHADKKGILCTKDGVVEYMFHKKRPVKKLDGSLTEGNLWMDKDLIAMEWLRPIFPDPIREVDHWTVLQSKRKVITEIQARKRAVAYARMQIGEPFKVSMIPKVNFSATKWDNSEWYCSLLIYKSYSRTVTNMYLEDYENGAGFYVLPDDLVNSKKTETYHRWFKKS